MAGDVPSDARHSATLTVARTSRMTRVAHELVPEPDAGDDDRRIEERQRRREREEEHQRPNHPAACEDERHGAQQSVSALRRCGTKLVSASVVIGRPKLADAATGSRNAARRGAR
jgi:hypothetical protein